MDSFLLLAAKVFAALHILGFLLSGAILLVVLILQVIKTMTAGTHTVPADIPVKRPHED